MKTIRQSQLARAWSRRSRVGDIVIFDVLGATPRGSGVTEATAREDVRQALFFPGRTERSLFFERKVEEGEVAASLHCPVRQTNECRPRKRHDGDEGKAVRRWERPGFAVWWKRSQYQISKNKYAIIMIAAHMPRHATGYVPANKGTDTRTLQSYLGHQSIQSTVRYTELAPGRFKNLWR
jgi:integrase